MCSIYRKKTKIIAVSENLRNKIVWNNLLNRKNIYIISPGVDINKFKPGYENNVNAIRRKLNIPINNKILLCAGRLIPEKGFDIAIQAFKMVLETNNNVHLVICVGLDSELGDFLELQKYKAHNKIHIIKNVSHYSMPYYYNLADIFLLPSILPESFGLVVAEALSCGVPVIAFNSGAIKEITNRKGTIIVHRRNVNKMAESISYLLENQHIMKEMGIKGREHIKEKYQIDCEIDRIIHLYEEIVRKYQHSK